MPQDRVKSIARACKRINDADSTVGGRSRDDLRNVVSNLVSEGIFDGFETGTRKNADAAVVPFLGRHTVEMNMVGITEAVASVLLDFPQLDELISLLQAE